MSKEAATTNRTQETKKRTTRKEETRSCTTMAMTLATQQLMLPLLFAIDAAKKGLAFAGKTIVIALSVTIDGTKGPLGLWGGSTENTVVATALLQNLLDRGLRVDESMLFVIDGGKALRKARSDVFGDRAVVQRCQVHKMRNVREHLPEARCGYVARQMRDTYNSATVTTAKKKLQQLASWLESNWETSAAASLREGLDETLTILRFSLPSSLRRSLATTNAIENSSPRRRYPKFNTGRGIPDRRPTLLGTFGWKLFPSEHNRESSLADRARGAESTGRRAEFRPVCVGLPR